MDLYFGLELLSTLLTFHCLTPLFDNLITRAVIRQHSSPEPVLAHHEHKVLNSKSIRKVMLLPYNTLKQSEFYLPFRHINKSMTLTSDIKWNGIV